LKKSKPRILDAGCGNRTMWTLKDSPHILYVDTEPELSYPPDQFVNITETDFKDKRFHLIFFDPPHEFGRTKNTSMFTTPNREVCNEKWPKWARKAHPRYYGTDKYASRKQLKEYVYYAQKEFYRIGTDDCVLMFKWSENRFDLEDIMNNLVWWKTIMTIPIKTASENATPSYWVMLMKLEGQRQGSL